MGVFLARSGPDWEVGAAAVGERVFEVRGQVQSISGDLETITVEHEEIPGLMPAMTMPFYLKEPAVARGIGVGDFIEFSFVIGPSASWIERIERVGGGGGRRGPEAPRSPLLARIPRLEPGDLVPGFQLIDQGGDPFDLSELYGRAVVLTFIFTRCPVPEFCPRISGNFQELQARIHQNTELAGRVHLVSVTIDPEFDTPDVLRAYAEALTETTEDWTFVTGPRDRIDEMTARFSVYIEADAGGAGQIDHALATALIGPDGRLVEIWRGNRWKPEEVIGAVSEALDRGGEENL